MRASKGVNFIIWEVLALFFIMSYSELSLMIPIEDTFGGALTVIFALLWGMLGLFSILMGIVQLR